jgi:hypothetical protein
VSTSQFTIYIHTLSGVLTDLENGMYDTFKKKIPFEKQNI